MHKYRVAIAMPQTVHVAADSASEARRKAAQLAKESNGVVSFTPHSFEPVVLGIEAVASDNTTESDGVA